MSNLKILDTEIFYHLEKLEVLPELFLTRWLRCMLSREFLLPNTLELWDFIFSKSITNLS